jgi:hypothetical protein
MHILNSAFSAENECDKSAGGSALARGPPGGGEKKACETFDIEVKSVSRRRDIKAPEREEVMSAYNQFDFHRCNRRR